MSTTSRFVAVLSVVAATVLATSSAALADAPTTWEDNAGRSTLDNLLYFGGGTVGLFVVVALFGLLTARNNYVPPPPGTDVEQHSGH